MIIFLGSQILYLAENLRKQRLKKSQTKRSNIIDVQYFCVYQQGVLSSTPSFIIYPLSSFYSPRNLSPNFPFSPPPPPLIEYDALLDQAGLQFSTTASPPDFL